MTDRELVSKFRVYISNRPTCDRCARARRCGPHSCREIETEICERSQRSAGFISASQRNHIWISGMS